MNVTKQISSITQKYSPAFEFKIKQKTLTITFKYNGSILLK